MIKVIITTLFATATLAVADHHKHPDTSGDGWKPLFDKQLSNAKHPKGVWTRDKAGVLTASKDQAIWSEKKYNDFVLDLQFMTAKDTNSGVIVHCSDIKNWIPNSVEIQIADDHGKWKDQPKTWQCAAIFGRLAAKKSTVKKPGEWNRYTITCKGKMIYVVLNGELVTEMDMSKWTDPKKMMVKPAGEWNRYTITCIGSQLNVVLNGEEIIDLDLSTSSKKDRPLEGYIGFQDEAKLIWYRNVRIKEIKVGGKQ